MPKTTKINYAKFSFEFGLKSNPYFLILPEEKSLGGLTESDMHLITDDLWIAVEMLE
jgi:hypothetical protein